MTTMMRLVPSLLLSAMVAASAVMEAQAAGSYAFLRRDARRDILTFKFQQGITSAIFDAMSGVPARSEGSGVRKDGPGFACITGLGIWVCGTAMTPAGAMAADPASGSPQVNAYVDAAPGPGGLTLTFLNSRRDSASRRAVEFIYDSMGDAAESAANGRRTRTGQAMTCTLVERGPGQSSCRVTVAPDGNGVSAGVAAASDEGADAARPPEARTTPVSRNLEGLKRLQKGSLAFP